MDSAKENPVLLVHRSFQGEEADAWARLQKALKTLGQIEVREAADVPYEELFLSASSYAHVFLDLALADYAKLAEGPIANLTLVNRDAFVWNKPRVRELMGPALLKHSCFLLEDLPAADLVRSLHLFLSPKRLVGVTPLLEKGSIVVAEKVQSLDALGSLTDRLNQYLAEAEGFNLRPRLFDFRLALSAILGEGFKHAEESGQPYPTVDFQVGAAKGKAVINLRFPRGRLDVESLPRACLDGEDPAWTQAWSRADFCQITHHAQHDEVEVMIVINRAHPVPAGTFRTLLIKRAERSGKRENLLLAPQNFEFRLLAQVRINQPEQALLSAGLEEAGSIDLGNLPPEVVKRLGKLEQEGEFFREQAKKKDTFIKDAVAKITEANKEISKKRNELLRVAKAKEAQGEAFTRKIAELEKRLEHATSAQSFHAAAVKESITAANPAVPEALAKLEGGLKAAETEKAQLVDKLAREEKKVTAFEQKYSALYKEITQKDKELNELKTMLVKARKEQSAALAAAANANGSGGATNVESLNAKVKEAETREAATRQELKKMAFKIENNDKNVKAIQAESVEKIKLLEQKLQAAKTKEVDLLRKIDELSVALKKAAKAA
jgi:predicted  nucleic acid-binding Zn-ribbon protein